MRSSSSQRSTYHRSFRGDRAETGIGTLIVFIAMILVAAVAAGVLVRTSTNLQQQAQSTGDQATERVSTGVEIVSVYGQRNASLTSRIDNITIHMQLSAGSPALDLNQLKIRWSDGATASDLAYTSGSATANTTYSVTAIRDADGTYSGSNPIVNGNDLIKITLSNVFLATRTEVAANIIPEGGLQTPLLFTTPTTYTTTWITLG